MRAIPLFRDARLNGCAKASNTFSAGEDDRGDSGGGAGGGGFRAVAGYAYDMAAGSVESGRTAVGKISGVIPVFKDPPPNVSVGQEPASWEGNPIGIDPELTLSVRLRALNAPLSRVVYSEAFAFGEADLTKALQNSGLANKFRSPLEIDGIAIGVGVAFSSIMLTERDHPKNDNRTFIDKNGVRHVAEP